MAPSKIYELSIFLACLSVYCVLFAFVLFYVRHVWVVRHSYLFFRYGNSLFGIYYVAKYGERRKDSRD